jgi:hypothetical protein
LLHFSFFRTRAHTYLAQNHISHRNQIYLICVKKKGVFKGLLLRDLAWPSIILLSNKIYVAIGIEPDNHKVCWIGSDYRPVFKFARCVAAEPPPPPLGRGAPVSEPHREQIYNKNAAANRLLGVCHRGCGCKVKIGPHIKVGIV